MQKCFLYGFVDCSFFTYGTEYCVLPILSLMCLQTELAPDCSNTLYIFFLTQKPKMSLQIIESLSLDICEMGIKLYFNCLVKL